MKLDYIWYCKKNMNYLSYCLSMGYNFNGFPLNK